MPGTTDEAVVDRGDDFIPTDDDAPEPSAPAAKPAADKPSLRDAVDGDKDIDPDPDDPDGEPKAEKEDKPKRDDRIPLKRHKELLEKERAARAEAEAKLAQYAQGQQVAKVNEDITKLEDKVLDLEKQYNKLLNDGEVTKAAELMTQIRRTERQIVESTAEMRMAQSMAQATEKARYDITLERIEEAYPALNPDHDDFDADRMQDVADLAAVYQRRGQTPTKALQAAVKKLMGAAETRDQRDATEVTPRVDKADVQKQVQAERRKAGADKTASATSRQPGTNKVGTDNGRSESLLASDVIKMSQDAFAKLKEEDLAKLRGDDNV